MAIHYLFAWEEFTKKPFKLRVPAYYDPTVPRHLKQPTPFKRPAANPHYRVYTKAPPRIAFYQADQTEQLMDAAFPVSVMLKMFHQQVEFHLVNEDDVVDLFETIDRYLESIEVDVRRGEPEIVEYAQAILPFREKTYLHYYRYMHMNPAAKERLYPRGNPNSSIFHAMSQLGTDGENHALDPVRSREKPPYPIFMPNAESNTPKVDPMELDYGVGEAANRLLSDNGRDFNLDDFTNGKRIA